MNTNTTPGEAAANVVLIPKARVDNTMHAVLIDGFQSAGHNYDEALSLAAKACEQMAQAAITAHLSTLPTDGPTDEELTEAWHLDSGQSKEQQESYFLAIRTLFANHTSTQLTLAGKEIAILTLQTESDAECIAARDVEIERLNAKVRSFDVQYATLASDCNTEEARASQWKRFSENLQEQLAKLTAERDAAVKIRSSANQEAIKALEISVLDRSELQARRSMAEYQCDQIRSLKLQLWTH